jgi:acyl-CoA thioester hydrolase
LPAPFSFPVRVYYEDTDFSGVVYHASYLRFMERARTEYLRALGIVQSEMFEGGRPVALAVRKMEIDFRRPATMDDALDVITTVEELGGASAKLFQEVRRGEESLVTAKVVVVAVAGGKAVRLPQPIREALR